MGKVQKMKAQRSWIAVLALLVTLNPGTAGMAGEDGHLSPKALREQFAEANRHYEAKEYEKARDLYRGIADKALSSEVQFNLGNCYFRLGQTGRACLAYRRALTADPGMVEARQNLRFLRTKLGYLTFETTGLLQAASRLTPKQWLWICGLGAWILVLGIACRVVFRIRQPLGGMVLAAAVCGGMVSLAGAWAASFLYQRMIPEELAIVVEDGATALTGPFPDARAVRNLPPGSEVRVKASRDEWLFIYLPGDSAGWIENRFVEKLWPSRS